MNDVGMGDGRSRLGWDGLTEAMRPVAETAATERLDDRKAFLNIVNVVQRMGG
jgi:hypothetical protein